MNIRVLVLAVFCGAFAAVTFGGTIYVSPEGAGNKDGTDEDNAYAARDCIGKGKTVVSNGDIVKLSAGTYHETGTEWYAVESRTGVIIEGDVENPANVIFDGQEGNVRFFGVQKPSGGTAAEVTIRGVTFKNAKSGSNYQAIYVNNSMAYIEDCVFSCITNTGGNGAAIFFSNNNSTGEVRRCSFTDCAGPNNSGGAIARNNTSDYYTLYDCAFTNCTAKNAGGAQGVSIVERCKFVNCSVKDSNGGGAIWDNVSGAEIRGCDFIGCSSGNKPGGAIYLTALASIVDCNFSGCTAGGDKGGGAIYASGVSCTNCVFSECKALSSNGGAVNLSASASFSKCKFADCTSATHGGAIYTSSGVDIQDSQFSGCSTQYGGAIGLTGSGAVDILSCVFTNNTSSNLGSAICLGAAGKLSLYDCRFDGNNTASSGTIAYRNSDNAEFLIERCVFSGNFSARGSGLYCDKTPKTVDVRNSLFAGCVTTTGNGGMALELKGGACTVDSCTFANCRATGKQNDFLCPLELNGGTLTARNCIFWDNLKATVNPPERRSVYIRAGSGTLSHSAYDGMRSSNTPTISECEVITECPFVQDGSWVGDVFTPGDYTLVEKVGGEANPCLGTGLKLDWMTADSKDLAGNPRLRGNDIVDLGCYAYFNGAPKHGLLIFVR